MLCLIALARPEALVPIMKGTRRLVLVGDHKQLPPVVQSEQAKAGGLQLSLFQRLLDLGAPRAMLQVSDE
jgi:regulator of nonsense transcripts 1